MKILLLGEYSSLHKYLKEGLQELGSHSVKLLSDGDGWKKIGGSDGTMYNGKTRLGIYASSIKNNKKYQDYDVVQIISPNIFPSLLSVQLVRNIKKRNGILSMTAAGGDYALCQAYLNHKFDYYVYDNYKKRLQNYNCKTLIGKLHAKNDIAITNMMDIIIPGLYEYSVGYENYHSLYKCIPYPINVKKIEYSENKINNKLVFFHGINNELVTGTPLIRKSLGRLKEKYPNDVEVIIDGHLPFDKYIEIMKRTNVVVDQCYRYGYGMNAGIALAMGKVVMSGARAETLSAFGLSESPIICTYPDEEKLYQQYLWILENKNNITEMGYRSREYVETVHDYISVSQKYIDAWNSVSPIEGHEKNEA